MAAMTSSMGRNLKHTVKPLIMWIFKDYSRLDFSGFFNDGRKILQVVSFPCSLLIEIKPEWSMIAPITADMPSPLRGIFVVEKGSNNFFLASSFMQQPVRSR
jgi:hypothetical protein